MKNAKCVALSDGGSLLCQITHAESVKTQKPRRGGPATKRHSKRKDAKTWLAPFLDHRQHLPWEARRSGRIHEERKKAGKADLRRRLRRGEDLLTEPLFLPSCFVPFAPWSWSPLRHRRLAKPRLSPRRRRLLAKPRIAKPRLL